MIPSVRNALRLAALAATPLLVHAITVVECVDSAGHSSFRDRCPPEMTVAARMELRGKPEVVGPDLEEIAKSHPVVLYSAPNCEACDLVRDQLIARKVPFSEKDSSEDREVQSALAEATGGTLTVPTTSVGDQSFVGHKKSELDAALSAAGYPERVVAVENIPTEAGTN